VLKCPIFVTYSSYVLNYCLLLNFFTGLSPLENYRLFLLSVVHCAYYNLLRQTNKYALLTMVYYIELMLPLHVSVVKPPSSGSVIRYSCHIHLNYELFHM
jgi:hypothetical protein